MPEQSTQLGDFERRVVCKGATPATSYNALPAFIKVAGTWLVLAVFPDKKADFSLM